MPAAGVATSDQKTQARQGVDGTLSRIKEQYDILKKEKEIVSTENTTMENIAARTKTKLGPSVGRTVGTKAQSARDTIANLRQALLADIKAATGMSSKAIDSNVELQSFLASLGDPDQSFETIRDTLAELSKKYGTGTFGAEDAEPRPPQRRLSCLKAQRRLTGRVQNAAQHYDHVRRRYDPRLSERA